ncbi:hypothetical protein [Lysinibacillus sp. NPDC093216]|uniref:hypothetical protein n=1 Tax=Lysinibacillus sp. NPDC093216 TaxID=3390576 RepID=UPI003D03F791
MLVSIPIKLPRKAIRKAVLWSVQKLYYSIDRANMNGRDLTESLDDKIMGDLACVAVWSYLYKLSIVDCIVYDEIRKDNFNFPDPGWDIAIKSKDVEVDVESMDINLIQQEFTVLSIKSSRLPRTDTIEQAILKRDFKIFNLSGDIEKDITADIEVQVYYKYVESQLGNRLINKEQVDIILNNLDNADIYLDDIINALSLEQRWGECWLVGFKHKEAIVAENASLRYKTWSSFGKNMWISPLKTGLPLEELSDFVKIKNINN